MLAFIPRTICILSEQYLPTLRSLYTALVCVPTMMIPLKSGARGPISMIKLRRATRVLLSELSYNEQLKRLDPLLLVYQRELRDLVTFYRLKCGHYNCSLDFHFQFCSDMILIKVIHK